MAVRFSSRTSWDTEQSSLSLAASQRISRGLPLLDLTESNPTRCGFTYPESLLSALADPRALAYDPNPRGMLLAREAVADYYARHGASVDPSQILLTTSTSEAYSYLFRVLCDPDTQVLIPQPGYPLFDYLADLNDLALVRFPLIYDHGWQLDPYSLQKATAPLARALAVVHPNNPTGSYFHSSDRALLREHCLRHNLALIVDEVFLDYPLGPSQASFTAEPSSTLTFTVSGLSKIAGLPQMKVGWIVAQGEGSQEALERLEVVADSYLSMNAPAQYALSSWLSAADGLQQQILDRVHANAESLTQLLSREPSITALPAEAGWCRLLHVPAVYKNYELCLRLLDHGVNVHPGDFYGLPSSGWLVISMIQDKSIFINGVQELINVIHPF